MVVVSKADEVVSRLYSQSLPASHCLFCRRYFVGIECAKWSDGAIWTGGSEEIVKRTYVRVKMTNFR